MQKTPGPREGVPSRGPGVRYSVFDKNNPIFRRYLCFPASAGSRYSVCSVSRIHFSSHSQVIAWRMIAPVSTR